MKNVVREKKIYCGNYMEVDIYNHTILTPMKKGRAKKKKVSPPKQKNLNDKNARRYHVQLVNANFGEGDLHVTLTHAIAPETVEEAVKEVVNYLRRVSHKRKREGLPPLKYILITEGGNEKGQEKKKRIHHHIIMNGGLDRDVVEDLWRRPRKKGQQKGDWIGFVNADRLKPNDYGLEAVARYLMKSPNGKKRWSSSQNLIKPEYRTNDHKYTRRQVEQIVRDEIDNQLYWKKKYPEWDVTEVKPVYTDINGWSLYLKLRRARE
ncbi:rolling circle replication-associated protein [Paenibacillus apiarius]|uniref:rolling circle replication-associated protein n=1 Tax=Paenibacillus apiarius TaxID=46240 RepID=UPI003B3B7B5F